MTTVDVATPYGTAKAHVHAAARPRAARVLGHGAAGGVTSPDLVAVRDVALEEHVSVALVEQPYKVAGRRSPAPAHQLDASWTAVVEHLRAGELADRPLVVGGRSLGARVACRTAEATRALAVLCLAFPVHPPGRPEANRLEELDGVTVPVLVVQGDRDPFGMPPPADGRVVVTVPGDHSLKTDVAAVAAAVRGWFPRIIADAARTAQHART
jgi:predicted alpha/beta-hydrolase family hydrolase